MHFNQRTVLITGAAGTIGRAVAVAFFREGANLALVDSDDTALEQFSAEAGFGDRALLLCADVTNEQQVAQYVANTVSRFGAVDVFFNNAGITGCRKSLTDMDSAHFRRLMEVNVGGVYLGLKYVLRQMYVQGSGVVINTASQKGRLCTPGSGDYATAKSAVIMLTKVAALEAAANHVRVNCILPGIVHSSMITGNYRNMHPNMTDEQIERAFSDTIPVGRWCEPHEVADMVMFLASDTAAYLTGTELHLDGGTTAAYL